MRRFIDMKEDAEETNYWMPVANMLAAFILVLLLVLGSSFVFFRNTPQSSGQQPGQQPTDNVDESYLAELKAKEDMLNEQSKVIKRLSGIRDDIIDELSEKLAGLDISADIDKKTGIVRFSEAVLFDVNSVNLKPEGEEYLKKLIPEYLAVVLSEKNREHIDQIIIEGHADDGGTYLYNLALSQNRSYSVVGYLTSNKLTKLQDGTDAEKFMAISGKSFNKPIVVNGTIDRNKSRRVELVFMLKYDRIIDQIQEVIKGGVE